MIHAGWKGAKEKILEKIILKMKEKFESDPSALKVVFGPSLSTCCYQVKDEFKDYFPGHVEERQGQLYLDLNAVNKQALLDCGVLSENIHDCDICTYCNQGFFSHRREGEIAGRMISAIMLKDLENKDNFN